MATVGDVVESKSASLRFPFENGGGEMVQMAWYIKVVPVASEDVKSETIDVRNLDHYCSSKGKKFPAPFDHPERLREVF